MKDAIARKLAQIPPGCLLVGIDPHKNQHAAVVMTPETNVVTKFKIDNSLDGFEQLCHRVEQEMYRQSAEGAMYAIEAGAHFWRNLAYFLYERGKPFRLVNPYTLKRRREGDDLDHRKNDYRDATMAAELLRTGKFTDTQLLTGLYAELRSAHKAYHRLIKRQTRVLNLLTGLMDGLFPEFRQVFTRVDNKTALTVLWDCPAPGEISRMSLDSFIDRIRRVYRGQRLALSKLQALHEKAQQSAGIAAGAEAVTLEVRHAAQELHILQTQGIAWEAYLTNLVSKLPETRFLLSIPGLSQVTVAGLLGELGPLDRYNSAKQLVKMAGTNPTESESAGKRSPRSSMSKRGRSTLRSCLWMAALQLLHHNEDFANWAKALKERPLDANPLKPGEAVGAVANRLLRVAYALVKHQTTYRSAVGEVNQASQEVVEAE